MTDLLEQKRCPQCHHLPEVEYIAIENSIELSCEQHGHLAKGDTMVSAIANWNYYIGWIVGMEMAAMVERRGKSEKVL